MISRLRYSLILLVTFSLYGRPYHRQAKAKLQAKQQATQQQKVVQAIAQPAPKKRSLLSRFTKQNSMELRVEGIECDLCAQAVVDVVAVNGGQQVQVNDIANDYEHCYLSFVWPEKNKNIFVKKMRNDLEKEGFELVSLKGGFYGVFKTENKELTLSLDGGEVAAAVNKPESKKIRQDKLMLANGTLSVVLDHYNFELV